jgi:hypothetical protein
VVVIESGARTTRLSAWLATFGVVSESVAETVKLKVPVCEGIPASTPEVEFSVKPVGKGPEASAQVYGLCPPAAAKVVEYAVPEVALDRLVVVIESAGTAAWTTRLSAWLATFGVVSESVAETVKLKVPVCEGVPASTPEAEFRVTPVGKVPEATAHVYGLCPPAAAKGVE